MSTQTEFMPGHVYDYLLSVSVREHPVAEALRAETAQLAESNMQIAPEQGQFMSLLVKLIGARRCIEVGTFTGYSALITALALPEDGQLIACDVSEEWTDIGRRHWRQAGVEDRIDLRLQDAARTLEGLLADGQAGSFDFAFIDADKTNYGLYYERCLELLRPGGLLALDNTLWSGRVADPAENDEDTRALRAINRKIADDERVDIALVPIADGVTLARKR